MLICLYKDEKRGVFLSAIIKYSQYVLFLLLPKRKYQPFSISQLRTDKSYSQVCIACFKNMQCIFFSLFWLNLCIFFFFGAYSTGVNFSIRYSLRNLPKVYFFVESLIHLIIFYVFLLSHWYLIAIIFLSESKWDL